MARITSLFSGSSGNSTLLSENESTILIDMGRNCKAALEGLYELGASAAGLSGILVTHEHTDHISALKVFLKHYRVPVYASEPTLAALEAMGAVPPGAMLIPLSEDSTCAVGNFGVTPFKTSHDSACCFGYRVEYPSGKSCAIATDLGYVSDGVRAHFLSADMAAIESNYDEYMLRYGRYPEFTKRRIRSQLGHLSNDDCSQLLGELVSCGMERFMLMHLSMDNNTPDMALTSACSAAECAGASMKDCIIEAAPRYTRSRTIEF